MLYIVASYVVGFYVNRKGRKLVPVNHNYVAGGDCGSKLGAKMEKLLSN